MSTLRFPFSLLIASASGVLLALCLPKPDFYHLGWVAFIPLLLFIPFEQRIRRVFAFGYSAGLTYYAGTFYWIISTMSVYGGLSPILSLAVFCLFILIFAIHTAVFAVSLRFFISRFGRYGFFLAPVIWVGIELLQTYMIFGGFPWMLVGYALAPYKGILQIVAWTGIYGLSFVLVLVNAFFAFALWQKQIGFGVVAALLMLGAFVFPFPTNQMAAETLSVRLVQTNIDIDQHWQGVEATVLLDELHSLSTRDGIGPDLIVWPETPAPFYLRLDNEFMRRTSAISDELDAHFLLGYIDQRGSSLTNSAGLLSPDGRQISRYDKLHLVPFGEYVPFKKILFFVKSLVRNVGNFEPGSEYTLSTINGHRIATTICYEDVFPQLIREFTKRGAEVIINITNDGWFGSTSAPYQHLRMATVRAAENRRYLLKATNTGITAIIDPYGRILKRTDLDKRTTLEGRVGYRKDLTFYVRYGDVFACFMAFLTIFALVTGWRRKSVHHRPGDSI